MFENVRESEQGVSSYGSWFKNMEETLESRADNVVPVRPQCAVLQVTCFYSMQMRWTLLGYVGVETPTVGLRGSGDSHTKIVSLTFFRKRTLYNSKHGLMYVHQGQGP